MRCVCGCSPHDTRGLHPWGSRSILPGHPMGGPSRDLTRLRPNTYAFIRYTPQPSYHHHHQRCVSESRSSWLKPGSATVGRQASSPADGLMDENEHPPSATQTGVLLSLSGGALGSLSLWACVSVCLRRGNACLVYPRSGLISEMRHLPGQADTREETRRLEGGDFGFHALSRSRFALPSDWDRGLDRYRYEYW